MFKTFLRYAFVFALLALGFFIAGFNWTTDPPSRAPVAHHSGQPIDGLIASTSGTAPQMSTRPDQIVVIFKAHTKASASTPLMVNDIYLLKETLIAEIPLGMPRSPYPTISWAMYYIPSSEVLTSSPYLVAAEFDNQKRTVDNLTAMVQEVPIVVIIPMSADVQQSWLYLAQTWPTDTKANNGDYLMGVTYELIMPMNTVILSHHGPVNPPVAASSHNTVSNCQATTDLMLGSNAIAG